MTSYHGANAFLTDFWTFQNECEAIQKIKDSMLEEAKRFEKENEGVGGPGGPGGPPPPPPPPPGGGPGGPGGGNPPSSEFFMQWNQK